MIIHYSYSYQASKAEAKFKVDTGRFTAFKAQALLDYFSWKYNREADPIDELMKKLAIKVIAVATENNFSTSGVIFQFNDYPGFPKLDGSSGITLISATAYTFKEELLGITKS